MPPAADDDAGADEDDGGWAGPRGVDGMDTGLPNTSLRSFLGRLASVAAMRTPLSVVIGAGGTGGHIYPGLALADALRRADPMR